MPAAVKRIGLANQIFIPVVVLGEFLYGIAHSNKRKDYETWIQRLRSGCELLNITGTTADSYAQIQSELRRSGKPIPSNDTWIAALAREHNLDVMSRDTHFDRVAGLRRISW